MKIAILIDLFPPKWLAGTEIATYYVAEHLAQRGHDVHVITSMDEGLPEESAEKGFYIHRLPRVRVRFAGPLLFWVDIVRAVRRINPDIVHAQSLGIGISAYISKIIGKYPYAVWGQGSEVYLPDWFTKITLKIIIKNADSAIALTSDMKQAMQRIHDREISIVPNGIDLREYPMNSPIHKGDTDKQILFVGRLHPVKGVQYLLQAMQELHKQIPNAKLILVGDGEERDYLETLTDNLGIRRCVEFVGKVTHDRVRDFMYLADVFVLPSLSEGFPLTILEAMACSLPIVATRVGGLPDIIDAGVNGCLVEAKNPGDIAEKLLKLCENGEMRDEISANNRRKAEKFSWDVIASSLEDIYKRTVTQSLD